MLIISSREFRQNQKQYFERVDEGEHIIVQRGRNKSYVLTPVSDDDMYFNADMLKRIKESVLEVQNGETKTISTSEEIKELLGL